MDALLGALARGDIGQHFPDHDPAYEGSDSLGLLAQVIKWMREDGYEINNIDGTIVAEHPKMSPFKEMMRENFSKTMDVPIDRINVKATTTEKMGFTGREEGIEALAVVSLVKGPKGPA
jgi:2-C-methyl-D-erythritol 2,4-cyclodiphosphate synthase